MHHDNYIGIAVRSVAPRICVHLMNLIKARWNEEHTVHTPELYTVSDSISQYVRYSTYHDRDRNEERCESQWVHLHKFKTTSIQGSIICVNRNQPQCLQRPIILSWECLAFQYRIIRKTLEYIQRGDGTIQWKFAE